MSKLTVFNHTSLDGYFTDPHGDMSWAHKSPDDAEWNAYVQQNAGGDGRLVFGRVTYEMMASFWPTPMAREMMPAVAERMNVGQKVVFSRTLTEAKWQNTTLFNSDLVDTVRALKADGGPDMTILGSGTIVSQLAQAGLVDAFQIVVDPVVLGRGRTLFATVPDHLALRLTSSRVFRNGAVVLGYEPA